MNIDKIEARVKKLVARLEGSKIQADELPGIVDAAWDVVEVVVASSVDKRLTFFEVRKIWSKVATLRSVVAAARRE